MKKKSISRRTILKTGAAAGVAATFGGVAGWLTTSANRVTADPPMPPKGPDLILLNGNRPGYHTPLENAYSIADIQAMYAARAAGIPAGAWITTIGGFNQNHFWPPSEPTPRLPTLAELDAAVPNNPAFILQGFTGPTSTNTLGKNFFEANGVVVAANGSIATTSSPGNNGSGRALNLLRQTLLRNAADGFEQRKRSVRDAIAYAAQVGVTTHLDQGAFQTSATNPETDGAAHEDNFTMHLPFLAVYDEGNGIVRLRINFLHMETDPALPELVQRLKNQSSSSATTWSGPGRSANSSPSCRRRRMRPASRDSTMRRRRSPRRAGGLRSTLWGDASHPRATPRTSSSRSWATRSPMPQCPESSRRRGGSSRTFRASPRSGSLGSRISAGASLSPGGSTSGERCPQVPSRRMQVRRSDSSSTVASTPA